MTMTNAVTITGTIAMDIAINCRYDNTTTAFLLMLWPLLLLLSLFFTCAFLMLVVLLSTLFKGAVHWRMPGKMRLGICAATRLRTSQW